MGRRGGMKSPKSPLYMLGMGDLPLLKRNPYNGYIFPYYWVEFPIAEKNMEVMGVLHPSTYRY